MVRVEILSLRRLNTGVKGIKRGFALLTIPLPSPLMKGRGIKGEGLIKNLLAGDGVLYLGALLSSELILNELALLAFDLLW